MSNIYIYINTRTERERQIHTRPGTAMTMITTVRVNYFDAVVDAVVAFAGGVGGGGAGVLGFLSAAPSSVVGRDVVVAFVDELVTNGAALAYVRWVHTNPVPLEPGAAPPVSYLPLGFIPGSSANSSYGPQYVISVQTNEVAQQLAAHVVASEAEFPSVLAGVASIGADLVGLWSTWLDSALAKAVVLVGLASDKAVNDAICAYWQAVQVAAYCVYVGDEGSDVLANWLVAQSMVKGTSYAVGAGSWLGVDVAQMRRDDFLACMDPITYCYSVEANGSLQSVLDEFEGLRVSNSAVRAYSAQLVLDSVSGLYLPASSGGGVLSAGGLWSLQAYLSDAAAIESYDTAPGGHMLQTVTWSSGEIDIGLAGTSQYVGETDPNLGTITSITVSEEVRPVYGAGSTLMMGLAGGIVAQDSLEGVFDSTTPALIKGILIVLLLSRPGQMGGVIPPRPP